MNRLGSCLRFFFVFLAFSAHTKGHALSCLDKVAIAPPQVADPVLGDWLVEEAKHKLLSANGLTCQVFLDYEQTVRYFDYVGMSSYFRVPPDKLKKKQILFLKEHLAATQFMFLDFIAPTSLLYIKLYEVKQVDELVFLKATESHQLELAAAEVKAQKASVSSLAALLTPNMLAMGFSDTVISLEIDGQYEEDSSEVKGMLPPIISSVSFSKVDHPIGYANFDLGLSLLPGVFLYSIDQVTKAKNQQTGDTATFHMQAHGACGNVNAEANLYWTMGTTYVSYGFGPCWSYLRQEGDSPHGSLNVAGRILGGHRVFVSERWLLYLEFDALEFSNRIYDNRLAHSNRITRMMFGLGWYVFDAERQVSKFLHRVL